VQTIQEVLGYAYPSSGYKVKHGDKFFTWSVPFVDGAPHMTDFVLV
jgi:hypothetical protein